MNVLLYIVKDPKEEKGAQNRWQGKDWLLSVFFFTLKAFSKGNVSGGTLQFRKRRKYWLYMTKFKRICCIKRTWNNTVMHFLLYLHLLVAKILGSIFYCILDFLLDFQETAWVAFFISGSQWMNNHINKTLKTSCSRFYPLKRLLGRGQSVERWTAKFVDKKKDVRAFK